ncbi:MAG: HlyD family type I secretion periplasmic adaptor subunit, partial [Lutimaribacter sp.]
QDQEGERFSTEMTERIKTLRIPSTVFDKLPNTIRLLPGMPVEAFIRTGDRTPLAYLTKPLTDYFSKAFRDG